MVLGSRNISPKLIPRHKDQTLFAPGLLTTLTLLFAVKTAGILSDNNQ